MKQQNKVLVHGGDIYSHQKPMIDFSANINPLGMPSMVKQAIIDNIDSYECYPDPLNRELIRAISEHDNVGEEHIVCGNGAADVIFRIALALKPKRALILAPTFAEYEQALAVVDSKVDYYILKEINGFEIQKDILDQINSVYDIVFICNPNNPTGLPIKASFMLEIAKRCKQQNVTLVIDECFTEFLDNEQDYSVMDKIETLDNVIILKAFTKIYAMAGIRLGYAVCGNIDVASEITHTLQPWSVSTIASKCGVAALKQGEFVEQTKEYIKNARTILIKGLEELGFTVYESKVNYVFFRTDIDIINPLVQKGILVRSCKNYNYLDDRYYRVAVKTIKDNEYLLSCLKEIVG